MSWHFSRALVEAFSQATCSDGEQFAPLRSPITRGAYCWRDRTIEPLDLFQFGMTSQPSTADLGEELLTWFREDSRARTSASLAGEWVSMACAAGSGEKWRESSARFDPVSRSWRTAPPSSPEGSAECSVTWPRSGMTADGRCWELPMSGRRTSVTGSGSLLPTPTVHGNYNRKGMSAKSGDGLATYVKLWPTPDAHCWKSGPRGNGTGGGEMLSNAVVVDREEDRIGTLSPAWVEWLMGWPIGWSSLDALDEGEIKYWRDANDGGGNDPHEAEAWFDEEAGAPGEDGERLPISRTVVGVAHGMSRLKALGNGQVPRAAAAAWRALVSIHPVDEVTA